MRRQHSISWGQGLRQVTPEPAVRAQPPVRTVDSTAHPAPLRLSWRTTKSASGLQAACEVSLSVQPSIVAS